MPSLCPLWLNLTTKGTEIEAQRAQRQILFGNTLMKLTFETASSFDVLPQIKPKTICQNRCVITFGFGIVVYGIVLTYQYQPIWSFFNGYL